MFPRAFDDCWSNGYHSVCLSQVSTSHLFRVPTKFPICHPTPASEKSAQAYASLVFLILPSRFWILLIICLSLSYHINSWNGLTWKVGLGPLGTLGTLECFLLLASFQMNFFRNPKKSNQLASASYFEVLSLSGLLVDSLQGLRLKPWRFSNKKLKNSVFGAVSWGDFCSGDNTSIGGLKAPRNVEVW